MADGGKKVGLTKPNRFRRGPVLCWMLLILMLSSLELPALRAEGGEVVRIGSELRALDQIEHQILRGAYLGHPGTPPEEPVGSPSSPSAAAFFEGLNERLKRAVEPGLARLREAALSAGESGWLDQIALRELRLQGLLRANREEYEAASELLRRAARLARRLGEERRRTLILNTLAYTYFQSGDERALATGEQAVQLAESLSDSDSLSLLLYNLGWLHLHHRQFERAVPILERAVRQAARLPLMELPARINLGLALFHAGHLEPAGEVLRQALRLAERVGSARYRTVAALDYALLLAERGRPGAARPVLWLAVRTLMQPDAGPFLEAEKHLLSQCMLRLARQLGLDAPSLERGPAAGSPAGTGTSRVHSHLSHLIMPVATAGASPSRGPAALLQGGEAPAVQLTLKEITTLPNTFFSVPVYLKTGPEVKLKTLTFEVAYPRGALLFNGVEKGFRLHSSEGTAEATPPEASGAGSETIRITARQEQPDRTLPDGLILFLSFTSPRDVRHNLVRLQPRIVAARSVEGASLPAQDLSARDESVYIDTLAPVGICFFYLH